MNAVLGKNQKRVVDVAATEGTDRDLTKRGSASDHLVDGKRSAAGLDQSIGVRTSAADLN